MMSTQTQPAAPDADEPTAIVADDKATALAAVAWSADDDDTELFDDDEGTTFWLRLYVGITAAVVLVLGVVLWFVLSDHHQPTTEGARSPPRSQLPAHRMSSFRPRRSRRPHRWQSRPRCRRRR